MRTFRNTFFLLSLNEKKNQVKLIILDVLINLLDIGFLAMLLYIIHFYTDSNKLKIYSLFPFALLSKYPLLLILVFFILFSVKNLFGLMVLRNRFKFIYNVASRLSKKNLINYFEGSYKDYVEIDSAKQIRKISQQPLEFCYYVLGGYQQIISQFILIIITLVVIVIFNAVLLPLLFIILSPPVILSGIIMKRKLNAIRKNAKSTNEKALQYLQESISSFIESNIDNKKDFFVNRYLIFQNKFNDFLTEQQVLQNMPSRVIEIFAVFGLLILILINSIFKNTDTIDVLVIGMFMAAAYKIIPGIVKILNSIGQIKTYQFTIDDLLLVKENIAKNKEDKTKITSIEFSNIMFAYGYEKIISDFSAQFVTGDFVCISGLSGKGKTTLINLLLGFLKPTNGYIMINQKVKKHGEMQQHWNRIAYAKQQSFFIYDTILKNIILDEDDYNAIKLDEIISATGLDEIIDELPLGLHTHVTENGKNFSGGQRQRIVLARALYTEFDLLILDEPFSELDEQSELRLLAYLQKIMLQAKIIFLITHNKAAMSFCNKKICMDD